eukprot:TRINITY_DN73862_c0_g1_i1.p2 TRINITY_DN73862_c0_g1~~TRINITY_DN73862_c0_g1_i1.p2  ORF type:complete len:119 (-),score=11.78 TRINITY_DN73862_c0_g1_i1:451-807(-)
MCSSMMLRRLKLQSATSTSCLEQRLNIDRCFPHRTSGEVNGGNSVADRHAPSAKHRKILVGNLPDASTREALLELFSQGGPAEDAVIIQDRPTNKSGGFGFVYSAEAESSEAAMNYSE